MKYIQVVEFLNAPKKVQDSIWEWWKIEKYDIVWDNVFGERVNTFGHMSKENKIPLLTVGQLIEYIEYKVGAFDVTIYFMDTKENLIDVLWEKAKEISL